MAERTKGTGTPGGSYCCVVGCSNNQGTCPDLHFYRLPSRPYEKARKLRWIEAIRRQNEDGSIRAPPKDARVCSNHFVGGKKSDIEGHPSYVPTVFLPPYRKNGSSSSSRLILLLRHTAPSGSIKIEEELDETSLSSPLRNAEFISGSYPESTMASDDSICIKEEPDDSSSSQEIHGRPSELLTGDYAEVTGMASDITFIKEEPQDMDSPLFPENHGDSEEDMAATAASNSIHVEEELAARGSTEEFMTTATMVGSGSISVKEEPQGTCYLLAEMHGNSEEVITGATAVKAKWTNMRSQYQKEVRKGEASKKSGPEEVNSPKWAHFEALQFITASCKQMPSTRSLDLDNQPEPEIAVYGASRSNAESGKRNSPAGLTGTRRTTAKRKADNTSEVGKAKAKLLRAVAKKLSATEKHRDVCDAFGALMAHVVRGIPEGVHRNIAMIVAQQEEALTAGVLCIKKEPQDDFDFPTSCSSPLGYPGPALEHGALECANSALAEGKSLAEQNYVQERNNAVSSFQQTSLATRDAEPAVPKLFRCSMCSVAFLKYSHRNAEPDTSTRCDDCVYQALSTRNNVRRRKGKRSYKCGECSSLFVNRCLLERHMIVHTGEKPYRCDVCRHTFSYLEALKAHMREHTGEESFKCEICSMTLSRARDLKRHMTTHNRKKPFKCEACNAAFSRAGDLNRHKRTHTGEKPLKCEVCSATFASPGQLKRHNLKHTGEKPYRPYKCKLCPADFLDSKNLTNHMRTHTGEKPYRCDLCPAEFCYATNLAHHVRTHTAKKRFKCELCPSAFVQEASLRRHIQTHMGVKPYKCRLCTAAFSRHGQFRSHMLSHIGEKPFKCLFCAAEFSDSLSLESHVAVHMDDDVQV